MIAIQQRGCTTQSQQCHECGCRFAYDLQDLRTNYITGTKCISCPTCGEELRHRADWSRR